MNCILLRTTSENHTEEYAELAVTDLRRETDELSDGGETTESSHRWTDEVESEVPEESEALSDVEETPFAQESEEFCFDTRVTGSLDGNKDWWRDTVAC